MCQKFILFIWKHKLFEKYRLIEWKNYSNSGINSSSQKHVQLLSYLLSSPYHTCQELKWIDEGREALIGGLPFVMPTTCCKTYLTVLCCFAAATSWKFQKMNYRHQSMFTTTTQSFARYIQMRCFGHIGKKRITCVGPAQVVSFSTTFSLIYVYAAYTKFINRDICYVLKIITIFVANTHLQIAKDRNWTEVQRIFTMKFFNQALDFFDSEAEVSPEIRVILA